MVGPAEELVVGPVIASGTEGAEAVDVVDFEGPDLVFGAEAMVAVKGSGSASVGFVGEGFGSPAGVIASLGGRSSSLVFLAGVVGAPAGGWADQLGAERIGARLESSARHQEPPFRMRASR